MKKMTKNHRQHNLILSNMKKTIKQRRLEFLEDTIKFYSEDVKRRAAIDVYEGRSQCFYRTEDGRKCAIGRWIPDDKYNNLMEGEAVCGKNVMSFLPKKISDLESAFLMAVQALHDISSYWTEEGLSDAGINKVGEIKELYIS